MQIAHWTRCSSIQVKDFTQRRYLRKMFHNSKARQEKIKALMEHRWFVLFEQWSRRRHLARICEVQQLRHRANQWTSIQVPYLPWLWPLWNMLRPPTWADQQQEKRWQGSVPRSWIWVLWDPIIRQWSSYPQWPKMRQLFHESYCWRTFRLRWLSALQHVLELLLYVWFRKSQGSRTQSKHSPNRDDSWAEAKHS